jgi:hypothetical protein
MSVAVGTGRVVALISVATSEGISEGTTVAASTVDGSEATSVGDSVGVLVEVSVGKFVAVCVGVSDSVGGTDEDASSVSVGVRDGSSWA